MAVTLKESEYIDPDAASPWRASGQTKMHCVVTSVSPFRGVQTGVHVTFMLWWNLLLLLLRAQTYRWCQISSYRLKKWLKEQKKHTNTHTRTIKTRRQKNLCMQQLCKTNDTRYTCGVCLDSCVSECAQVQITESEATFDRTGRAPDVPVKSRIRRHNRISACFSPFNTNHTLHGLLAISFLNAM